MDDQLFPERNMRRGFGMVMLYLLGLAIIYSWYSWGVVKQEEQDKMIMLTALQGKALESFFQHYEGSLSILAQQLQESKLPMEGERTHILLKRLNHALPDIANIIIERPDGQIIASALNAPGSKFPNYGHEDSFIAGRDALKDGAAFNIGRPVFGKLINEWVIPFRYAIRDTHGQLTYLLIATMPVSYQQSFWQNLNMPKKAVLSLISDEGYLLSQYPIVSADELESTYSKPYAGTLLNVLHEKNFPKAGSWAGAGTQGYKEEIAFRRVAERPVTFVVAAPSTFIRDKWLKRNQAFFILTGIFILSAILVNRWMVKRQEDWDAEIAAVNQKIIDTNHAKSQAEKEVLGLELDHVKMALDKHSLVSIADVSGKITYANEKFCDVSGYSQEELEGQEHSILNSGLHDRGFFIDMWQTINSGKIWHGQIRNKNKAGDYYWVESTIVPFLNKQGQPYQYVSVRTNITPLMKARAAAEEANNAKSQFLSSMSHELRTPLNSIMGYGQLLGMQIAADKTEQKDYVNNIVAAGSQLLGLINDLLDLSRIELGKLEFNIQEVSIAELASGSVALVGGSLAAKRNISVENKLVDTSLTVKGDGLRIRQVLVNLLSNAVKYNRDNGKVTLSGVVQPDGRLRVQVEDTGEGIAPEKLSLLFRHFERLDQKHGSIEGAGIGLYVCKQLVEAMQGEIGVESVVGQGSTFWFVLPNGEMNETASNA